MMIAQVKLNETKVKAKAKPKIIADVPIDVAVGAVDAATAENDGEKIGAGGYWKLAESFLATYKKKNRRWVWFNNRIFEYRANRYVELSDNVLAVRLRLWLANINVEVCNKLINEILPCIKAQSSIVGDETSMPIWIDVDNDCPWSGSVIAFQNGLLDLDKFIEGEVILHPHTDSWLSANCLPYNFNPDATCPLITSTLLHNLGDDESQLLLLEQFAGYSMTTDNSFHKILMLLGETRAGKGLCLELMRAIVGGDNCADIDLTSLLGEFGLAPLVGKQLAIIDEAGNSSKTDRDAVVRMLKRVSGGNRFSINEKFKPKQANVELYSKTVMAMNELPLGLDPSGALAGRALILSFPNSHLDCEDVELKDKLTVQSEIEGWAYRCLIGYRELKKHHRFIETAQSQRLRREFNQHNSPAACFVEDCLLVSKEYAPAVIDAGNVVDGPLSIHRDDLKLVILAYDGFGKQTDITWRLKFLWAVLKKCKPENRYQKIINGIALKPEARKWVDCAIDYYQNRGDGKMSDLVYVPVVSKADFEKSFYHR